MTTTELDRFLSEVKERLQAATPGPWADEDSDCVITTVEQLNQDNPFPVVACTSHLCLGDDRNPDNGPLIASAPEALARLVRICERQHEALHKISQEGGEYDQNIADCALAACDAIAKSVGGV